MSQAIFVDTGPLVAAVNAGESRHAEAVEGWTRLANRPLVVSNLVVAEAHALILRRSSPPVALRWLRALPIAPVIASEVDHRRALEILQEYTDQSFSYCDAVSFAIMERFGLQRAWSFDRHFTAYGWLPPWD